MKQYHSGTASLGLLQFSWTCPNCLYIFHISEAFFPAIQTRSAVRMNQVILWNLESETVGPEKCQQMVCVHTNYFSVGSEKGHFPKKTYFAVNQTRMSHFFKEWRQLVPNSNFVFFYNGRFCLLQAWRSHQQKATPAGIGKTEEQNPSISSVLYAVLWPLNTCNL